MGAAEAWARAFCQGARGNGTCRSESGGPMNTFGSINKTGSINKSASMHRSMNLRLESIRKKRGAILIAATLCLLTACSVGPNYHRPAMDVGTQYKELTDWKPAEPKDELIRGKWWQVFGDAELNELAAQIDVSNQNLKAAEARYRQAVALVKSSRAGYFPTIGASASGTRSRAATRVNGVDAETVSNYNAGLN